VPKYCWLAILGAAATFAAAPSYAKLQTELLALSRNSKQLVADKSFHAVAIDQPEVIITAIREVVEAVRGHLTLDGEDRSANTAATPSNRAIPLFSTERNPLPG
jgi:hypothetical protein